MNRAINEQLSELRARLEAKSMTYGTLPSKAVFSKAWADEMGEDEDYNYSLKGSDAETARKVGVPVSGSFGEDKLYSILKKLIDAFDDGEDAAGDIASGIMQTLGFEWI